MASRRSALSSFLPISTGANEPHRELFESCRNGDITRVKKLANPTNVNARDTAGRKSSPLHFAAGIVIFYFLIRFLMQQHKSPTT